MTPILKIGIPLLYTAQLLRARYYLPALPTGSLEQPLVVY